MLYLPTENPYKPSGPIWLSHPEKRNHTIRSCNLYQLSFFSPRIAGFVNLRTISWRLVPESVCSPSRWLGQGQDRPLLYPTIRANTPAISSCHEGFCDSQWPCEVGWVSRSVSLHWSILFLGLMSLLHVPVVYNVGIWSATSRLCVDTCCSRSVSSSLWLVLLEKLGCHVIHCGGLCWLWQSAHSWCSIQRTLRVQWSSQLLYIAGSLRIEVILFIFIF